MIRDEASAVLGELPAEDSTRPCIAFKAELTPAHPDGWCASFGSDFSVHGKTPKDAMENFDIAWKIGIKEHDKYRAIIEEKERAGFKNLSIEEYGNMLALLEMDELV